MINNSCKNLNFTDMFKNYLIYYMEGTRRTLYAGALIVGRYAVGKNRFSGHGGQR